MRLADIFTLSRIVLAPVFFVLYFIPVWTGRGGALSVYILVPLLAFMEFTDFLDGYFARKQNSVSDFGKLFDPFADVLVHLTTFLCFVVGGYMPAVVFVLILYREFGMNFVRLIAARKGVAIAARKGGKLKTVLYVATGFYFLGVESCIRLGFAVSANAAALHTAGIVLSCVCLVASYVSFVDYLVQFKSLFVKKNS
ncbi:CDP-diacylglycerol--glycerol-3-phosphate 3-phosphatidyltransferase [Treponema brennaborense]|uniref:CDP-diacylglycerol--glycerol-3-phosphate 3-phosphatidyltransferase n=1 Tax=Treponema brennaborense (strain DSM 12168 / CIP 105900 / DD5/3) TaxID=906968 RepID=F4LKI1_TREBD|nr:CDP-diacylglycerol--glycerol-3-phosphate 3-phosphatidyltransferase [Treponema brennaborense]AEE17537.1 CDP-diacylglycerol/glycerol-3-phosphate 3-phosphatidyltransferase [Treponema brennaborense DSM 12168]